MAISFVNGRRVETPNAVTPEELASAAGIPAGRRIIRKRYDGNFPLKPGERFDLGDSESFVDAPRRVKGA